ncbi:MAG: hypothetical protein KAY37_02940 [Phycisphaerae bacterium]|nr:hypothetical protein [Phycisphaerae bacterium]
MPSPLTRISVACRGLVLSGIGLALLVGAGLTAMVIAGCQGGRFAPSLQKEVGVYPPKPQVARVVALGNLRGTPPPSKAEIELAMFLFGAEPLPPLALANPTGLAANAECVLICDTALDTVFRWDLRSGQLAEACKHPSFEHPFALDIAPGGECLVCDRRGVMRCDADGNVQCSYRPGSEDDFKPTGVLAVGNTVWVSNDALHRIEVFDTASGLHLRSIGRRGDEPGQFNLPRSLARTPDGNVCIVDMLNNRVQVFDPDGNWRSNIGQAGDSVGSFGRPKDVAVGPDGTIFVTDAFSQRVHAFAPDGQPLMAFGEPGSGIGELFLPNGIAVTTVAPQADRELPSVCRPAYYVLVAEQLSRPGVRVYAWLGHCESDIDVPLPREIVAALRRGVPHEAVGPHWDSESCAACHEEDDDENLLPIASDEVSDLCLDCHEGHEEAPFMHPVDSEAAGAGLRTPTGWPLVDGQLGCLTCHDIHQQCNLDAQSAVVSAKMLRRYDPSQASSFCTACHVDNAWSGSPHRQLTGDGQVNPQTCLLCHEEEPAVPSDGVRRLDAKLRSTCGFCLDCHIKHGDCFPAKHVGRLVPPKIRRRMLARALRGQPGLTTQEIRVPATEAERRSTRFPLVDGRIACYTCHNPHQVGLFPAGSELATWATSPSEAAYQLRADRPGLCLECHEK